MEMDNSTASQLQQIQTYLWKVANPVAAVGVATNILAFRMSFCSDFDTSGIIWIRLLAFWELAHCFEILRYNYGNHYCEST